VSAKITADPNLVYDDLPKLKITADQSDDEVRKAEEDLKAARRNQQRNIDFVLILGIPTIFAAYGLVRWRRRLAARANVSLA
jgi:hypothetical protein